LEIVDCIYTSKKKRLSNPQGVFEVAIPQSETPLQQRSFAVSLIQKEEVGLSSNNALKFVARIALVGLEMRATQYRHDHFIFEV